jgi:hypothetical protein
VGFVLLSVPPGQCILSRRERYKGNRDKCEPGAFLRLPIAVLNSRAYLDAGAHARMLLFDLACQYRGDNNGDLSGAWSFMRLRGWRSKETLTNAKRELMALGLIVETRMGCSYKAVASRSNNDSSVDMRGQLLNSVSRRSRELSKDRAVSTDGSLNSAAHADNPESVVSCQSVSRV